MSGSTTWEPPAPGPWQQDSAHTPVAQTLLMQHAYPPGLLSASRYVGSIASTLVLAAVVGDDGSGLATMLIICAVGLALSVAAARRLPGRLVGAPELVP